MSIHPPLPPISQRSVVQVARGRGPYENTRRVLEAIDLGPLRGKRVLLKPNVGRVAACGSGVVTHAEVVAAAIDALRQAGAEVAVGESPIVGVDVAEAFEVSGIAAACRRRDCPLVDLDRRPAVKLPVPYGRAIRTLAVCADVAEAHYVVSVPVMKMHMHTGVTLAIKNMKGCLWRRSKVKLHMLPPVEGSDEKPIDIALADLASVLRPSLAIIDGTVAMEGLGPSAGRPRRLDVVLASADGFAADAVACHLMGKHPRQIPHLRLGAQRGYGTIDLNQLTVLPENWQEWITPLEPPPENLTLRFPNVIVLDRNSCSACQSTLLLFLARHAETLWDYFPGQDKVHIAIGKGVADLPRGTLCVGNCTAGATNEGVFVPGCPPVGSQILSAIRGEPAANDADDRQGRHGEQAGELDYLD